ncbi:MAG TPA: hypothetical protein VFI72_08900 [Candidatus Angelobacter sp.]|nr:hypothetical protein [Candidatus Angelobacter sp.]
MATLPLQGISTTLMVAKPPRTERCSLLATHSPVSVFPMTAIPRDSGDLGGSDDGDLAQ